MIARTFFVYWLKSEFLVVDASQTIDVLLELLKNKHLSWVVLKFNSSFYIFKSSELKNRLQQSNDNLQIHDVLNLAVTGPSQICNGRTSRLKRSQKTEKYWPSSRVVALDKHGEISRIGEIVQSAGATKARLKSKVRSDHKAFLKPALTRGIKERGSEKIKDQKVSGVKRQEFKVVPIFFATDRIVRQGGNGVLAFSNERCYEEKLTLGTCHITIPRTHTVGKVESLGFWSFLKFEFHPNPAKHLTLLKSRQLGERDFYQRVGNRVNNSSRKELFVFVHGYNETFSNAALRTAQIANDLQFKGAPILYSWPSRGDFKKYPADASTAEWSQQHFEQFIKKLAAKSQAAVIHVIAHSMGNRIAMRGLNTVGRLLVNSRPILHQIVLTAPDIDAGEFINLSKNMNSFCDRVTMYASSRDKALKASSKFHSAPRAGEAGKHIVVTAGVDTIDATTVDTSFLAHSYFSKKRTVISDIFYLLEGIPPNRRHGLDKANHLAGIYWVFKK